MFIDNLFKIEKDPFLLELKPLYQIKNSSVDEFINDTKVFFQIRRVLKSINNKKQVDYLKTINLFLIMFNCFGYSSQTIKILDKVCEYKYTNYINIIVDKAFLGKINE